MVGLSRGRRGRNRTTTNNTEERRTYPLVTPAQRIRQQQMDRPAVPQLPPRIRLPQGTQIALVPAKRPKTEAKAASAASGSRSLPVLLEDIRSDVVVPALLSPLGSSNDGEVVRDEGEVRDKMADPTPTKEAEGANTTAHASSARDAPSENVAVAEQHPASTNNRVIVIADVHIPAETVHEQPNNSHEDAPVGDDNREPRSLSQEEADQKFAEMAAWKRKQSERIAANNARVAIIRQEVQTLRDRIRDLEAECAEKERDSEKCTNRLNAFRNLFSE